MGMYVDYFKRVMAHKKLVFKKCWKKGLKKQAIMHDMSKFLPSEFVPYAKWFNGPHGVKITDIVDKLNDDIQKEYQMNKRNFEAAVQKHYKRNKHHWDHWATPELIFEPIPQKYLDELLCDWESVGVRHGNSAQEYYLRNYHQIIMRKENRWRLEMTLGFRKPEDIEWDPLFKLTIDELFIFMSTRGTGSTEEEVDRMLNHKFRHINERYGFNFMEVFHESYDKMKNQ